MQNDAEKLLYKMKNEQIKKLFNYMNYPLPSEFTLKNYMNESYYKSIVTKLQSILKNEKLFVIIDESFIHQKKIVVILGSNIENQKKLIVLIVVEKCNCLAISNAFFDLISKINLKIENILLIIYDAAAYIKKQYC
ncbi:hypothetical protein CDIK_3908 [Cucumispora dikerogammari]|nr:hypothetical protein CDIK_3908 [Cucumispora dikerogammari]